MANKRKAEDDLESPSGDATSPKPTSLGESAMKKLKRDQEDAASRRASQTTQIDVPSNEDAVASGKMNVNVESSRVEKLRKMKERQSKQGGAMGRRAKASLEKPPTPASADSNPSKKRTRKPKAPTIIPAEPKSSEKQTPVATEVESSERKSPTLTKPASLKTQVSSPTDSVPAKKTNTTQKQKRGDLEFNYDTHDEYNDAKPAKIESKDKAKPKSRARNATDAEQFKYRGADEKAVIANLEDPPERKPWRSQMPWKEDFPPLPGQFFFDARTEGEVFRWAKTYKLDREWFRDTCIKVGRLNSWSPLNAYPTILTEHVMWQRRRKRKNTDDPSAPFRRKRRYPRWRADLKDDSAIPWESDDDDEGGDRSDREPEDEKPEQEDEDDEDQASDELGAGEMILDDQTIRQYQDPKFHAEIQAELDNHFGWPERYPNSQALPAHGRTKPPTQSDVEAFAQNLLRAFAPIHGQASSKADPDFKTEIKQNAADGVTSARPKLYPETKESRMRGRMMYGRKGWQSDQGFQIQDELASRFIDPTRLRAAVSDPLAKENVLKHKRHTDRVSAQYGISSQQDNYQYASTLALNQYELEAAVRRWGGDYLDAVEQQIQGIRQNLHENDGGLQGNDNEHGFFDPDIGPGYAREDRVREAPALDAAGQAQMARIQRDLEKASRYRDHDDDGEEEEEESEEEEEEEDEEEESEEE